MCQATIFVVWPTLWFLISLAHKWLFCQTTTLVVWQILWFFRALTTERVDVSKHHFGGLTDALVFDILKQQICGFVKAPPLWFDRYSDFQSLSKQRDSWVLSNHHCCCCLTDTLVFDILNTQNCCSVKPQQILWFLTALTFRQKFCQTAVLVVWPALWFSDTLNKQSCSFVKPPLWWFDRHSEFSQL